MPALCSFGAAAALLLSLVFPLSAEARGRALSSCQAQPRGPARPTDLVQFSSNVDRRFDQSVVTVAEEIVRKGLRPSVTIFSGFRDCGRNRRAGGSSRSKHLQGLAADIVERRDKELAFAMYRAGVNAGRQVLYNSCRPHVHLSLEEMDGPPWDECGGKGTFRRSGLRRRR